jgi:Pentapeptide repeats (8 copies)
MANDEHVALLQKAVAAWNAWREENPTIRPNLFGANLRAAHLSAANLIGANLRAAHLGAANLFGANLFGANLSEANLSEANLSGANLQSATLVNTDFTGADLAGCRIYGVSAWGLKLGGAKQQNLVVTPRYPQYEPAITVDDIEVARFIYLMLHNQKVRTVIDTITTKAGADPRALHG